MSEVLLCGPQRSISRYSPVEVAVAISYVTAAVPTLSYGRVYQVMAMSDVYISPEAVMIVNGDYIVALRGSDKGMVDWFRSLGLGLKNVRYHRRGKLKTVSGERLLRLWETMNVPI